MYSIQSACTLYNTHFCNLCCDIYSICRLFPTYNLGEGLINISTSYFERKILQEDVLVFSWFVVGRSLVYLGLEAVVYFAIVIVIELYESSTVKRVLDRWRIALAQRHVNSSNSGDVNSSDSVDIDVAKERVTVHNVLLSNAMSDSSNTTTAAAAVAATEYTVLLQDLCKIYPSTGVNTVPKVAVKQLNLGIQRGECFGLLGQNGAGKSSTLSCITGIAMRNIYALHCIIVYCTCIASTC
jgi:ATP-binding cassette, subfamily A (ABC1), member 3